jgi:hypothetical protein
MISSPCWILEQHIWSFCYWDNSISSTLWPCPSLHERLRRRTETLQLLKNNLTRARQRMVQQANSKRRENEFSEGIGFTWNFNPTGKFLCTGILHPPPYRTRTSFNELDLSVTARIHPVFHVSLLKPRGGQPEMLICPIPTSNDITSAGAKLIAILGRQTLTGQIEPQVEFS